MNHLDVIATDDPVTCAVYAKKNNLLDTPGWKQFKKIARRHKRLVRMLKQSKLRQSRRSPIYKFGFRVPRNHAEAVEIDTLNGNTKWQDAERLELAQIDEHNTFTDKGKATYGEERGDHQHQ
jgi:ATP-dependent phosphoenolpyruvate carboxykinase